MRRAARISAGLAVLLVLAIGPALFVFPQPAAAADDTVTTVLQPGVNLAGWTEAAASIEAIFDAIPELDLVYAWDAEDQWFRWAVRTDTGVQGDLKTLTPGMGLWLSIAGDRPVTWTRPLVPEAADAPLREGWNIAVWVGEDGIATSDALQDIDHILTAVQDADGREPGLLRRGEAFWLKVSAPREWWQPATEAQAYELPRIEFSGDFSSEEQAAHRADVEDVVQYFARRFGIWVSDLTIRFVEGGETGRGLNSCASYGAKRIRLIGPVCFDSIAHEYAHAIQDKLGQPYPDWLAEGGASRWEYQYAAHRGTLTYSEHLAKTVIPLSQTIEAPLLTQWTKGPFFPYVSADYFLAQLGTEFLVDSAGEKSLYDFFSLLTHRPAWHGAFAEAFGISIYEFSESFENYREVVAPRFRRVSGRVLGSGSKPVGGVLVDVYTVDGNARSHVWKAQSRSGYDGGFSVVTPAGSVALEVNCPHSGGGWYAQDGGLSLDPQDIAPVVVGGADATGIVIELPVTQAQADHVPCSFSAGVLFTILGSDGERLPGLDLSFSQVLPDGSFSSYGGTTTASGEVNFPLGQPSWLRTYVDPETKCPTRERLVEGSLLLGRIDVGGGFSPSQNWVPPYEEPLGVQAENAGERTIVINFPETCP